MNLVKTQVHEDDNDHTFIKKECPFAIDLDKNKKMKEEVGVDKKI